MEDVTRKFTALDSKTEIKEILSSVYDSLLVKGYNPINQLVGYIISEDPTYITNYNNARRSEERREGKQCIQHRARVDLPGRPGRAFAGAAGKLSREIRTGVGKGACFYFTKIV